MDIIGRIIDLIESYIRDPKKLSLILIGILIFQTIGGLFYIRSLKKNIKLDEEKETVTPQDEYTPKEFSLLLKVLNIPPEELYNYYRPQIDSLQIVIAKEEDVFSKLKIRQSQLKKQSSDTTEVILLNQNVALKREKINFYKVKKLFLENRSKELRSMIKTLGFDNLINYLANKDSIDQTLPNLLPPPKPVLSIQTQSENISSEKKIDPNKSVLVKTPLPQTHSEVETSISKKTETESRSLIEPSRFQGKPIALSKNEMKAILKKYDFFDYYWNKDGHGFANKFEIMTVMVDKVIIDHVTDLMWQQGGSSVSMNFKEVKEWLEKLNDEGYAGYHDWRLPTLEEAMTLMERRTKQDGFYIDSVFDKKQIWIWTSNLVKGEDQMWAVKFNYGCCGSDEFNSLFFVRAVRTIQSPKK